MTHATMHMLGSGTLWADVNVNKLLSRLALIPVMCSHVKCKHRDSLSNLHNHEEYICCSLVVNTDIGCLQTTCDDGDGWDAAVPVVPSTAPAGVNYVAGSTGHGGQMPQFTLPLYPCRPSPEISSSPAGSVSRAQSAPQLGKQRKHKGIFDWCNCNNAHTCQVHQAQVHVRKLLRRGFLSPLAAPGTGEEHFSPFEARDGLAAGSQVQPCTVYVPLCAP